MWHRQCFHAVLVLVIGIFALSTAVGSPEPAPQRTKVQKSKEKNLKRGTIEVRNDTGKECNDLHFFFKPSNPTIEKITVKETGKEPFPGGYDSVGPQFGHPGQVTFGRTPGDGTVKDGQTVKVEIAWSGDMPEYEGYTWTLNGQPVSAAEGAADQKLEIKGKDADAVRKAKAEAEAKAKREADARAKNEEQEAKKAADRKAREDAKPSKDSGLGAGRTEGGPAQGAGKVEGNQRSISGLQESRIETEAGTLRVLLPDDIRPGDTISGTVIAEPKGATPEERQKNSDELNGYVIELGDSKSKVANRKFTWTVPVAAAMTYLLFKPDGTPLRASADPIELPKPGPDPDPVGGGYSFPPAVQSGRPIRIRGSFDPTQPTEATLGGQPAEVLAESPRQTIVQMPRNAVGPMPIVIQEAGKTLIERPISAVRIQLSADKTTLRKGETATIRVEVEGLLASYAGDRLEVYFDPAYVIVSNDSPNVVEFFGPGSEPFDGTLPLPKPKPVIGRSIRIELRVISPGGKFAKELTLRAREPGPFGVSAHFMLEGDYDSISRPTSNRSKPPIG